jgi:predicted DNA-binding transcriptional regulator YafY
MARNEQLVRQHKVLQILERYRFGRTVGEIRDELVEELGLTSLHTRSVKRDLQALEAAGIDITSEEMDRGKAYKLGPMAKASHKITASATELMALSLGRDLLYPLAGTPFWQGIESFWHKIQDTLPGSVYDHYDKYRQILKVHGMPAKSYEAHHGMLKTINRSILEHRIVEALYQPVGKDAHTRRFAPYAVVFYHASLYVIADTMDAPNTGGNDGLENRLRHLKLDRFRKATALDEWFKPDKDFDLEKHMGKSLGIFAGGKTNTFTIRISAYGAPWVLEDPWHPEQQVQKHEDGSVTLKVQATHELEIIPRVLALGAEAELLGPPSCRKRMADMVKKMQRLYDN